MGLKLLYCFCLPPPSDTYRYYKVSGILSWGCFSEHSTLSVSLELKSKPSTVDCTLWLTIIYYAMACRICWRQETKAGHTRMFSSLCRDYFLKGHNQHSLLSVGWTVWTSSLNNECNCGPAFCHPSQEIFSLWKM